MNFFIIGCTAFVAVCYSKILADAEAKLVKGTELAKAVNLKLMEAGSKTRVRYDELTGRIIQF